ncbi:MAG: FHA domain-containing protein [Polyangiales bacterium]
MIRLRQTKGADSGRELEFDQDLVRIGRMPDSDVNFDPEVDLDASGRHAEIRSDDGRYLLIDTGSRNGTWLNGRRIKHAALTTGDEIQLGRGGPKLKIAALEERPSRRRSLKRTPTGASERDPRFDPFAIPATTATLGSAASSEPDPISQALQFSDARPSATRIGRRQKSALLWAAAGMVLFAAVALVVSASLQ